MKAQVLALTYKLLVKPLFFLLDPELVHNRMTSLGSHLGSSETGKNITKNFFYFQDKCLSQKLAGISFENPVGLSAGFDYEAQLTQILPAVGFGFETVGTLTNIPYGGNPKPRLGRLPKSKSLLVNKGFKSSGVDNVITKLAKLKFEIPIGISVGRSNSPTLKTLEESVNDIAVSFTKLKKASVKNAYYELNISCPNLIHGDKNITFYPAKNLELLLTRIDRLKLDKPLFIKMPITEDNTTFEKMLDVIVKHNVSGIIVGNLFKDRTSPVLNRAEVNSAGSGNFSGAPCYARSNELIALASKKCGKQLIIIGCGGIFDARDAYEKIKLGANLVMLITGMVYQGPQLIGSINRELQLLLSRDGYSNISEAVGAYQKI